jgi:hypothetical protein
VIPAEFDLADGLPREPAGSVLDDAALEICGDTFSLAQRATASQWAGYGERGDLSTRVLSVYPDAGTARSVATDLVATFEGCPRFSDGRVLEWTTSARPTADGDQGWLLVRFARGSGPRVQFPEVIQIVRLGTSLLVIQAREIHGVTPEDLTRMTNDQVAWLMDRQMCLLTDQGCAWRSDPDVLRPDGWGPWQLGMSREALEATGVTGFSESEECTTVELGTGEGLLSASNELVSIQVPNGVTTPEGIGLGSGRVEVFDLYWFTEKNGDVMVVRASPTADYEITLERDQVTELRLTTVENECSG